ncbi:uncharacterized protein B0H18DRAFT_960170 [Fomitopsis serialis]|uniref:uncharacterized protein n=1 Tax=Fomitopsis serialis TaxID=139415 RepID=UPI0020073F1C|nr:uncharacterized protein B0H18DRAFT_960170 [Neoantrodia serialis]KAH9913739.1 hypothetical protein B0H18DRAFT_960170 [Neoantrodia serialis]
MFGPATTGAAPAMFPTTTAANTSGPAAPTATLPAAATNMFGRATAPASTATIPGSAATFPTPAATVFGPAAAVTTPATTTITTTTSSTAGVGGTGMLPGPFAGMMPFSQFFPPIASSAYPMPPTGYGPTSVYSGPSSMSATDATTHREFDTGVEWYDSADAGDDMQSYDD